ncbi:MAG: class I SAM-dependent methyltransferase [Firmicutes bacterium]|nr:class I SAM-dependent methyltransferase [Bacillota bacterium]
MKLLELAHNWLKPVITRSDIVVDATMGNGYDTLFLAKLSDNVYAFDIQEKAITATKQRLKEAGLEANVTLIKECHSNVAMHILASNKSAGCDKAPTRASIKAAIFNLGYLPGSDKTIITKPTTTVQALEQICDMIDTGLGGRISIMVYPSHKGGECERDSVLGFVNTLCPTNWNKQIHNSPTTTQNAPILVLLEKQ